MLFRSLPMTFPLLDLPRHSMNLITHGMASHPPHLSERAPLWHILKELMFGQLLRPCSQSYCFALRIRSCKCRTPRATHPRLIPWSFIYITLVMRKNSLAPFVAHDARPPSIASCRGRHMSPEALRYMSWPWSPKC